MSKDSLDHFHISYERILTDQERVGKDYNPHLMLSSLKNNKLRHKPTIPNMDIDSTINLHSIGLSHGVDLLADKAPRLREEANFSVGYRQKQQEGGFGRGRGLCTLEADHLSNPRNYVNKLSFLKNLPLDDISPNRPAVKAESVVKRRLRSTSPIRQINVSPKARIRLPSLNPLDEFEEKVKRRFVTQYDIRSMYSIN